VSPVSPVSPVSVRAVTGADPDVGAESLHAQPHLESRSRSEAPAEPDDTLTRIGQVAERTGVSERTLRYYEEVGLLHPRVHRSGSARRYCETDIARVERIRTLQSLMGLNLEEIRDLLHAEDRLSALRQQFRAGGPRPKQALLAEGIDTLETLRRQVVEKMARLEQFRDDLVAKIARFEELRQHEAVDDRS